MAEYQVRYLVPIYAIYESETDEVIRVVVGDEEIHTDQNPGRFNPDVVTAGDLSRVYGDEAKRIFDRVESAMWPGWEFGW